MRFLSSEHREIQVIELPEIPAYALGCWVPCADILHD